MLKNYWLKALFFISAMLLMGKTDAQVKFKIELLSDSVTYQVSLVSEIGPFPAIAQNFINSATVTILAPTGQLTPNNVANQEGIWSSPDTYINPVTEFEMDYFVFNLTGSINNILFTPGLVVSLFTFTNTGSCAGAVFFMDNENDPFLNQNPDVNIGNQMSVLGNGLSNAFNGEFEPGNANCMGEPPCDLILDSISSTSITACGAMDGSIVFNASNNTGTIEYSINNGLDWFTNNVFSGLTAGEYTLRIRDDLCGQVYENNPVVIAEPGILVNLLSQTPPSCNNSFDGEIQIAASGGTAPYEYSINNGANWTTDSIFSSLGNSFYNIKARNADGSCESDYANNPLIFSVQAIDVLATKMDVSCATGVGGNINITATGGSGIFEYSIDNGTTWSNNNNFADLVAGSYDIFVRNGDGSCASPFQDNPLVIQSGTLDFEVNAINPDCIDVMNGSISIVISGSTGDFEYSIDSGMTWLSSGVFNNLDSGTYVLATRITGGNCLTFHDSLIQLSATDIDISLTTTSNDCGGSSSDNSITILATGGSDNFEYSNDDGVNWQTSNIFSDLASGDYQIKVRNLSGTCETAFINNPISFTENAIVVTVNSMLPSCATDSDGSISITASGGTGSFIYSIDNGVSFSNQPLFSDLPNGNYMVLVRDGNGVCEQAYENNPVQLNTDALVLSIAFTESSCANTADGAISMIGNGGIGSFEYSIDSGATWNSNNNRLNLLPDLYYLQLRNSDETCPTDFVNNPVDLRPDFIEFSIISNTPPSCETNNDGSLILSATGGNSTDYEYSIDNGNTFSNFGLFQNLGAGSYYLQVRNTGTDCVVNHPDNPIMVVNPNCPNQPVSTDCIVEYILSEVNGSYTISIVADTTWNFPLSQTSSAQISIQVPTGGFELGNIDNKISGVVFDNTGQSINPSEAVGFDFYAFNLLAITANIPYVQGDTVVLFSFENTGQCIGGEIALIGEGAVPDPNIPNLNFEAQLTVAGWGGPDAPVCSASQTTAICTAPVDSCVINYTLTENNGLFTIGMLPDTTWITPLNIVSSAQISIRIPTGGFQIENVQNAINGVIFEESGRLSSIVSGVTYDFISFSLATFGTTAIPFLNGSEVELFSFEINGACSPDSIHLVGEGSPFTFPNGEEDNIISQMTVAGWGSADVPLCVQALGQPLCTLAVQNVTTTDASFCGATDGTITIAASCDGTFTQFSIDNGRTFQSSPTFTGLSAGNYFIRLFNDSTDCEIIYTANPVVINDSDLITFTATSTAPTCVDSLDGSITFMANNGSGSYLYSIDSGRMWSTNPTFTGLPIGDFFLSVSNLDTTCVVTNDTSFLSLSAGPCSIDTDMDGQPDMNEDINMNGDLTDDDTDMDGIPNYQDTDDDGDGIATIMEEAGPNQGDANGDNLSDCLQANVATTTDQDGDFRTLEVNGAACASISQFIIHPEGTMSEFDPVYDFPFDLNGLTIPCAGTVDIQLYFHNSIDLNGFTYRKFGPMIPDDPVSEWYDFPITIGQTTIGGQTIGTISFQLTDGDMGDATGVDSLIVDPGGLARNVSDSLPCPINYAIEQIGNDYIISLTGDTSITPPFNVVNDAEITLRAPTGILDASNLVNMVTNVTFELDTAFIAPIEAPNFDYFVFKLSAASSGTTNITIAQNFKQNLFSFENIGVCSSDSLFLVGTGASFFTPPIGGEFLTSSITINGLNETTCVSNLGAAFCLPPVRDTLNFTINFNDTTQVCLDSAVQLTAIGTATVLSAGSQVNVTVSDNEDCIILEPANGFSGNDTLQVIHCGTTNPTVCDTTVVIVTVTEPLGCLFEYILEETNGTYTVRLAVDSTVSSPLNATSSMLVVIRIPPSTFNVPTDSITTLLGGTVFENTSNGVIFDAEEPDFGYIFFDINGLASPNYQTGDTLDLFSFSGNACTGDSIQLVGPGAAFPNPIVNGVEATSFLSIGQFLPIGGTPYCVNPIGVSICDPAPPAAPTDTLHYVIDFETNETVCIDSALQLLNNVGNVSICSVLDNVLLVTNNGSSCVEFQPSTTFAGNDTICVVHCDDVMTDFCDTTILVVTVGSDDSTPPMPVEDTTCAVNFDLALVDGTFIISMTSDTTLFNTSFPTPAAPNPFIGAPTSVMDITLRAPTGTLQIVNQIDFGTGREFVLTNSIISPAESPAYDYFVFGLNTNNTPTIEIRYDEGQTVDLFSFQNFNCNLDSIFLVGRGTDFPVPLIGGMNIETRVVANADSIPACVNGMAIIPAEISFTQTSVNPTTGNCMDGSITITASGGTGLYDYSIDNGVTWVSSNVFSDLEVGIYSVIVRSSDENCMTPATSVSLTNVDCTNSPPPCTVAINNVSPMDASCSQANGTITITATGPNLQYSINTGATFQSSNVFQNVREGIYNIVVRDSLMTTCEANVTFTLDGTDGPVIQSIDISDSTSFAMNEGTIIINATGSKDFQYSIDGGQNYFNGNSFNLLGIGTYNIMLINTDNSCPTTYENNPVIISEPCLVDAGDDRTICAGEMTTLSASGAATNYTWTPTTGLSATDIPNPIAAPIVTTTYFVINSDADCTAMDSVIITVVPNVTASFDRMISCTDLSANFTDNSTSAGTITDWFWDFGDGVGTSTEQNPSYTYFASGAYMVSLTVTTTDNCENTITQNIEVGDGLDVSVSNDATLCIGDCITLMATGGTTYQWAASPDLSATDIPNPVACPTETTTYFVTVMNDNGCTEMDSVTITIDSLDIGVSATGTSCAEDNGSITIFAMLPGAVLEFQIEENGPWVTNNVFNDLAAGNYNVSVRIAGGGCETPFANNPVQINNVSSPTVDLVFTEETTDCNSSDGIITITASGSSALIYSIDAGMTWSVSEVFENLAAGNYSVQVANADTTCLSPIEIVEVFSPLAPVFLGVDGTSTLTCESADGSIFVEAEGNGFDELEYSLNGMDWQDSNLFENLSVGNYTVFIQYQNGTCLVEYPSTVEILPGTAPEIIEVIQTDPTALDAFDGSIIINATGILGLEYSINNGLTYQASNEFFGLDTGSYEIIVRYIDDTCETAFTDRPVILDIGDCLSFLTVLYTGPLGCGSNDGHISIFVDDPINIEYSINNGIDWQSSEIFDDLSAGTYTILARRTDRSCQIGLDSTITLMDEEALMIIDVQTTAIDDCNSMLGEIIIQTNISNNLEYSIDNGVTYQMDNVFSNLAAGTYTIVARSIDLTCQASFDTPIILEEIDRNINEVLTNNPSGCNASNGSIIIDALGGFNTEFSINNGITWQNDNQFFNLPAGSYNIRVRTGICDLEYVGNPVVLGSPNGFSVVNSIPNAATCTEVLSGVSVTLSETISSFIVNSGNIENVIQNGPTLTFDAVVSDFFNEFSLTFTNAQGCEITESFIVFQATDTEADFVVIEPHCKEMEVSILFTGTATPMANLTWELDGGVLINSSPATDIAPAGSEITVRWESEGSRLIKLTVNDGGCVDDEFESIFVRKLPLAEAGPNASICMGQCVQLQGSGTGVWFTWSPAAGLSTTDGLTTTACPTETTTYYLTVMNADGCAAVDSVTINVETDFLTVSPNTTICVGESTLLQAIGGSSYTWSPTIGLNNPNIATPTANPSTTTTYTVISPNFNGCIDTAQVIVFVNPEPIAVACEDKTICNGDSIQLVVTTFAQYAWSPSNTLLNPNTGTPTAFPTVTTTYTVTVTDENGCTDTDEVVVFVNTPSAISAGNDTQICTGTSVQLIASGANTYSWSPTTGLNNPNISNPIANPTTTTTYTVTGTDVNGCVNTDQVTVTVIEGAGITASGNVTICEGEGTTLNVAGGTNYTWSPATGLNNPFSPNPVANPTVTTTYTVTSTSINGCPAIANVTVFVNPPPNAIACEDKMICLGDSIQLIVTTHAQYSWSPSNTLLNPNSGTPIAFPTETTTYTVTVTDENGCTDTDEVVVFVNNPNSFTLGPDITICGAGPVQLDAGPGFNYQWSPTTGLSNPSIRNPIATVTNTINYSVQVTTANGCSSQDNITINVNNPPLANAGPNLVLCPGASGQLTASGGVAYQWSPITGLSNPNIANPTVNTDVMTTYTVTVTDQFGCTDTDETLVAISLPLTIDPVITNATCCGNEGSALLNVSGGFGNATFNWTPNVSTSNSATNLPVGIYKVVVEDAQSCSVIFTFEIEEDCDGCPDMFGEAERCITSTDIESICLPIGLEDIDRYEVLIDGINFSPDHGCEFENLTAYSYALVEGQGNTGPYRIENWEVNGQMNTTEVDNIQDLTFWMNTIDPTGNWILNPSVLSIIGGNPNNSYGTMNVIQLTKWVTTTLQPNVTGIATSTVIEIDVTTLVRPMEIIITDTASCCSDTLLLRRCGEEQPCVEEIVSQNTFASSIICGESANLCLAIPFNTINNFDFEANGNIFSGAIQPCDFDTMFAYTYFTLPAQGTNGPYRINSWIVDGQMHSGMFDNVNELVSIMNQIDPTGNWILDTSTLTLQGGNNATPYGSMRVEQINTGATATLDINSNLIPMGTQFALESGNYEFLIINKNTGCQDRLVVNIACEEDMTETPVDTTVTPIDTTMTPVDTTVTPIDTTMTPIDTTVTPIDTTMTPVDTTNMDVCTDFISTDFLFSSISRCDSIVAFCVPIAFETINEYAITIDGVPFQGALSSCAGGTSFEIGVGGFNFFFENLLTGCQDSIVLAVNCQTVAREEVVSLVEGDSLEFCPEPVELIGDIISIENLCTDESGIHAIVDIDTINFCVNIEGLLAGQEQACLVLCDDNGICDTTFLAIEVTPKSTAKPVAMGDLDTTAIGIPITIAILENDSIKGKLQNMEILERPSNGRADFNDDNTITYTPDDEFCNSETPDRIMYGICNDNGCDTAMVRILVPCPTMEILTGFSPNGDGVNDFFTIRGLQSFPDNELQIFNRWGSLVFQQKGYKNKWDGTFNNQNLPDGTYFYLLQAGGGQEYSGFVQINR